MYTLLYSLSLKFDLFIGNNGIRMADVHVDMGNIKSAVILLCVIGLGVYVYLEFRKVKTTIVALEATLHEYMKAPPPRVNVNKANYVESEVNLVSMGETSMGETSMGETSVAGPTESVKPEISSRTIAITQEPGDQEMNDPLKDSEVSHEESPETVVSTGLFMDVEEESLTKGGSLNITELDRLMMDPGDSTEGNEDIVVPDVITAEIPDIPSVQKPSSPVTQCDKYKDKTVSELKSLLEEKSLPTSGNKRKMIERLVASE